jgi:hypothetical protein
VNRDAHDDESDAGQLARGRDLPEDDGAGDRGERPPSG